MSLQSTGQFVQFGSDYDRRRRLLADEYAGNSAPRAAPVVQPPQYRSQHYGNALFLQQQMRLSDLLPQRLWVIAAICAGGLAIIAALLAAYGNTPEPLSGWTLAPLDLSQSSSLAGWFSTMLLTAAAAVALLVYYVRRHRLDDYQGRYRVWLWLCGCLLLVSVDQTAALHRTTQMLLTAIAGTPLLGDGQMWWILPYGFLLGAVGIRLLLDVWENRLATAALAVAIACYTVALAARLDVLRLDTQTDQTRMLHGSQLVGHLMLLTAMLLYGRHAMLDATGQLPGTAADDPAQVADSREPSTSTAERLANITVHPPHSATPVPHFAGPGGSTTQWCSAGGGTLGAARSTLGSTGTVCGSASSGGVASSWTGRNSVAADGAAGGSAGSSAAAIQAAEASVRRKLTKEEKKALRRRLEMERLKRLQQ